MVPPFEIAAFALKTGDVSEPVQSPFGYHVIQVQTHTIKSLAEVKPEILAQLKPNAARQAVAALTDKQKVDISDSFFGPAPPATTPAVPQPAGEVIHHRLRGAKIWVYGQGARKDKVPHRSAGHRGERIVRAVSHHPTRV